jgi:hypothetical protein
VLAAPYHLPARHDELTYGYGRSENPTWTAFERGLAELEGGEAVVFASGMAAATAVLQSLLRPGDVLLMAADGYYTVRRFIEEHLEPSGVRVTSVATADPDLPRLAEGASLVWLETPSNPGLDVCDVGAVAAAAHRAGGLVALDNSAATPLGQLPLALGADLSVASDTKALTGHSDLVLGHVAARDPGLLARVRRWRLRTGAVPGRSKSGSPTAPLRPSISGSSASAPTPLRSPGPSAGCPASAASATPACRRTPPTPSRRARCGGSGASSPSTSATRPPPTASSPPSASSPTPPASAASTRRPSAGPGGAATRSPRA